MEYLKNCDAISEEKINLFRECFILNIDNYLNYKRTNLVKTIENLNYEEIHPLVNDLLKPEDIVLFSWIHVKPNSKISVHSDIGNWNWSLVIPIQNFLNTTAEIYTSTEDPSAAQSDEVSYFKYNEDKISLLESLPIVKPFFMNNMVPHTMRNDNPDFSFYISIRLDKNFMHG